MRKLILLIVLMCLSVFIGCSSIADYKTLASNNSSNMVFADEKTQENISQNQTDNEEIALTVYFSYGGNTEALAQEIHTIVGEDIVKIEMKKPYPSAYEELIALARNDFVGYENIELTTTIANLMDYDVIYLGSPVWRGTITPPVKEFLRTHNLDDKVVQPFVTHGGWGADKSFEDVKKLAPNADVRLGFATLGSNIDGNQLKKWLLED